MDFSGTRISVTSKGQTAEVEQLMFPSGRPGVRSSTLILLREDVLLLTVKQLLARHPHTLRESELGCLLGWM